jgi:hypothetical protein
MYFDAEQSYTDINWWILATSNSRTNCNGVGPVFLQLFFRVNINKGYDIVYDVNYGGIFNFLLNDSQSMKDMTVLYTFGGQSEIAPMCSTLKFMLMEEA